MKKYKQITRRKIFISMLLNPLFIFIYCISMYELYTLCRFGRTGHNIIVLAICMFFYLIWLIVFIDRSIKIPLNVSQENTDSDATVKVKSLYKTMWTYIAIVIIVAVTSFYGYKIYNTAINYNGKLAWVLEDLRNKRTVKLEHNNIFKDGIEGVFTDINEKIDIPKELYVSGNFDLTFTNDGTITALDTFIYGKDDKDKLKSFLITYDSNKSDKIIVHQNGYLNADYNKDKLLNPLMTTMNVIPLKETVNKWDENEYGIIYGGKRSWGYNTNGIMYIDLNGNIKVPNNVPSEIIGYTVSLFVPGKEEIYTPVRYNLVKDLENIFKEDSLDKKSTENNLEKSSEGSKKPSGNTEEEFYLSDKTGYRLQITGAAAGSRFYSLYGTFDGGITWQTVNENPFLGSGGGASGITFINEKLGFLALSHSGGSHADLYRTEDGGSSYEKVDFPAVKIPLKDGKIYNPFDFPGMPYDENGTLNTMVGQGSDGDYNKNCEALYRSKDQGITWEYVKEV